MYHGSVSLINPIPTDEGDGWWGMGVKLAQHTLSREFLLIDLKLGTNTK